jgi:hypothetical protein
MKGKESAGSKRVRMRSWWVLYISLSEVVGGLRSNGVLYSRTGCSEHLSLPLMWAHCGGELPSHSVWGNCEAVTPMGRCAEPAWHQRGSPSKPRSEVAKD